MPLRVLAITGFLFAATVAVADSVSYEFTIDTKQLSISGAALDALAINDQIPAPTIRAAVGDTLRVTFHNKLDQVSTVHWHGILLPPDQDGVGFLNTKPMAPGSSHTFEFPITHKGTFWYHSHTDLQIQKGLYGAVVLTDPAEASTLQDEVILFSDWTDEPVHNVLNNLKSSDEYYTFDRGSVQSWNRVIANGSAAIANRLRNSLSRMGPMDLADVSYDAFLGNGRETSTLAVANTAATAMKLRLVNGSTSSYFDVEYAGGPMTVIAADGQDVQPIRVQRLRMSTAETYDVLVPLQGEFAYELRATSFDGTGYAQVFIGDGEQIAAPDIPAPNLFLMDHGGAHNMADMDMDMPMSGAGPAAQEQGHSAHTPVAAPVDHSAHNSAAVQEDHSAHAPVPESTDHSTHAIAVEPTDHSTHASAPAQNDHATHVPAAPQDAHTTHTAMAGSAAATDVIAHMTDYENLIAVQPSLLPADHQWREIALTVSGSMERYVWSFDGKTLRESPQIMIRKGENVRMNLTNDTMMNHPLHLHGHFFRVVNQHGARSPLKHTVNILPMGRVTIEFEANETQDWLFHCHNQYHMKTGMNRVISYEQSSIFTPEMSKKIQPAQRWFDIQEFHLLTSFGDYEYSVFDERHEFRLELDTDLADTYEVHAMYAYHFNQFVSGFVGMETRKHHHDHNHDNAIAGFNVMLPLLIESEWRADDQGEFRVELQSEIPITRNFNLNWRWNTDEEYRYGIDFRLNNRWSVTVHRDTEYGDGVGIKFFY